MNRKTKAFILGAALLTTTGIALASGGPGGCERRGGGMNALSQLDNLSSEQREKLDKLFESKRETMRGQHEAMKAQREAFKKQIDDILTKEQREQLASIQGSRHGGHGFGGKHEHNW